MDTRHIAIDIWPFGVSSRDVDLKMAFSLNLLTFPEFVSRAESLSEQYGKVIDRRTWTTILLDRDFPFDMKPAQATLDYIAAVETLAAEWGLAAWAHGCEVVHQAVDSVHAKTEGVAAYEEGDLPSDPIDLDLLLSVHVRFAPTQGYEVVEAAILKALLPALQDEYWRVRGGTQAKPGRRSGGSMPRLRRDVQLFLWRERGLTSKEMLAQWKDWLKEQIREMKREHRKQWLEEIESLDTQKVNYGISRIRKMLK